MESLPQLLEASLYAMVFAVLLAARIQDAHERELANTPAGQRRAACEAAMRERRLAWCEEAGAFVGPPPAEAISAPATPAPRRGPYR